MFAVNSQTLIETILNTDDFSTIINACSDYLNNPLVIINNAFDIIGYSTNRQPDDDSWLLSVSRGYITMEFSHVLSQWSTLKQYDHHTQSLIFNEISQYRRKFYRLEFQGNMLGYLNITEFSNSLDEFPDASYDLVRHILSKEIYSHHLSSQLLHKTIGEQFLLSCCNDLFNAPEQLIAHFNKTKLAHAQKYQFILINLEHLESYNAHHDTLKDDIQNLLPYSIQIIHNDYLVILSTVDHIFKHQSALVSYLKSHRFQAYQSRSVNQPTDFIKTYRETLKAKRLCLLVKNNNPLVSFVHLLFIDFLDQAAHSLDLRQFVHPKVMEIKQYDITHQTDYLNTLYHYLHNNQSILKTAADLFLHRNTVNYRISKIEELFDLSLNENTSFAIFYSIVILMISKD